MRVAIVSALLSTVLVPEAIAGAPQTVESQSQPKRSASALNAKASTVMVAKKANVREDGGRRCAFLGRFGSFTVIGAEGTAAYRLGRGEYIADLEVAEQKDANWWLYRPVSNGDPWTEMWAFARRPQCGMYAVMRFSNGGWHLYESTHAWGENLGGSGEDIKKSASASVQNEVLDTVRRIEDKLKVIQPNNKPSLPDLEKLIKGGEK